MRIVKENTIGVIIDMQEKLIPAIANSDSIIKNTVTLIKGLQYLEVPFLITQQYTKGLGKTIPPVEEALGEFDPIEKATFSCCDEPIFMEKLSEKPKTRVLLAGIEAHVCVLQTTIDLIANNYTPVLITDCISSRSETNRELAFQRLQQEGAILSTYEAILFELCRSSKSPQFKNISKLVK